MNPESDKYCVVIICGNMRSHDHDWAGLCLSCDRQNGLVVKPLEVVSEAVASESAHLITLKMASHVDWPVCSINGEAIMERMVLAPDGIGRIDLEVEGSNCPPMLLPGNQFAVQLSQAERAMLHDSPEVMRGNVAVGNVSESEVYSLFERDAYRALLSSEPASARAELTSSEEDAFSSPADIMTGNVRGINDAIDLFPDVDISCPSSASQTHSNHKTENPSAEWDGVRFLREQLSRQTGIRLVLARRDVENLLAELESAR